MLKQEFFKEQAITIAIIGILHILAEKFYLYWVFWWFDILMHFLGGVWVGFLALWFLFFSGFVYKNINSPSKVKIFLMTIATVILVGALWEVFEFYAGLMLFEPNYSFDTSLDMVMDTLGGVFAFIYGRKYFKKEKENEQQT